MSRNEGKNYILKHAHIREDILKYAKIEDNTLKYEFKTQG